MTCRAMLVGGWYTPNLDGDKDASCSDRGVDNEVGAGKNGERKEETFPSVWWSKVAGFSLRVTACIGVGWWLDAAGTNSGIVDNV